MDKFFVALLIFLSLGLSFFIFLLSSAVNEPHYIPVEISVGSGFKEIAGFLAEEGIIRSKPAFIIYGVFSGSAHQLKPGNYLLSSGSSTPAIISSIKKGPILDVEVIIPEGATVRDIDNLLSNAGVLLVGALNSYEVSLRKIGEYEFLTGAKNFEGFLFPDTYRFFLNSSMEQVVKKFLDNFEKKAWPFLKTYNLQLTTNNFNLYQLLIIASLLEKEAPDFKDRQIITGILYKRLKIGMGLQVDATITYAKCKGAFITCKDPKVYRSDLSFQSRYNTYLYNGFPPGPIGNPGLDAIKAALNPIDSEYMYYLSDPKTGKTIFSKTLDEHLDNRARYLTK